MVSEVAWVVSTEYLPPRDQDERRSGRDGGVRSGLRVARGVARPLVAGRRKSWGNDGG